MNWFDRWFAKKSKQVWEESKRPGSSLPVSRADYLNLVERVSYLERQMMNLSLYHNHTENKD